MYVSVPNSQQLFAASKVSVDALLDPERPASIDSDDFLKRIRSRLENSWSWPASGHHQS